MPDRGQGAQHSWEGEMFRLLVENVKDYAIFALDAEGRVQTWSHGAERLLGYREEEIVGQPIARFFTPEDVQADMPRQEMQRAVATGRGEDDRWHVRKDGSRFWSSGVMTPLRDEGGALRGFAKIMRDRMEFKRAEEHLEDSEQRFRTLTSHSPVGIFQTDAEGNCLFVNEKWCELAGMSPEAASEQGWVTALHSDDRERVSREWYTAAQAKREFRSEYRFRTPEGKVSWLQGSAVPLGGEAGDITGHIGTITDITDRKHLEGQLRERVEKLAEAEGRVRSVVNNVIDGIITIDAQGSVQSFNPAAERIFGYPAAEVIGQNVKLLMPEPYHGEHDGYIDNYLRTRQAKIIGIGREVMGRRKDGSTFPMDLAVSEFRLGDEHFFTGVVRDITERKQVQNALHFLADASASLAALVDYQSTLQKVAGLAVPHFADWCAVDMLEPDGSLRRLAAVHADPAKVVLAQELQQRYPPDPDSPHGLPQVLRTEQSDMMADIPEHLIVQAAQDEAHLHLLRELGLKSYMCVPLKGRDRLLGVVSFVTAESGRNYTEADLAFAEELARRAAIAIENAQLYAELREADRLKDEFLAMLAHELRNPLAPIRNALHIMKQPEAVGETLQQVRDMAERQVQHMARLLDDLLDVSRISRGRIELRREAVDVAAVVGRTVEAVRPLVEERRHELTLSLPARPLRVEADPTRLEQVLTNLLNNAAKYTDPGGHIRLTAEREGGEVVLRVRDTGIGIAPDMLPRIFDLFVQAERRLERSQGGVGIGLTLVKKLVELHGGRIEVSSEGLGRGSEFVVRLPAASERATEQKARAAGTTDAAKLPSRRVLVVDDNQDAAESLAMLLRLAGQDVRTAYEGRSALAQAQSFRPEVILLDIGMPGMDGYEVARLVREQHTQEKLLIVAITGWGQEEDRLRCYEAGFDGHLVKPVEPELFRQFLAHPKLAKQSSLGN